MVNQRDYKMISIFEVFAINRNEEDFLENLGIFSDLALEPEGSVNSSISPDIEEEDLSDPRVKILADYKDQLTEEEYIWCKEAVKENGKNVNMLIEVFKATNDMNDFIHSLKKCFKVGKK